MSNSRITVAEKIDALTDDQIKAMAKKLGKPYLDVVKQLQSLKAKSEYYQSDKAKAAAKAYRERAKAKANALKALL